MANELRVSFHTGYSDLWAMISFDDSGTWKVRDVIAPAWDVYNNADLDDYDIALTEGPLGVYLGDAPSLSGWADGDYSVVAYQGSKADGTETAVVINVSTLSVRNETVYDVIGTGALIDNYLDHLCENDGGFQANALADIQKECNDALVDEGLDHIIKETVTGTDVTDNSIIAKLVSKEATADWDDFVNTTDSLQAIHDAQLTASDVNDEVDSALDTEIPGAPTAGSVNERMAAVDDKLPSASYITGTAQSDGSLDAVDIVKIYEQASSALSYYDGPTNTEMEARTLPSANYFDPSADTVAQVTLVDVTTSAANMRGTDNAALASTLATNVTAIQGATFNTGTDSLEALRNRGDSAWTGSITFIGETSAASVASNTVFTINTFSGVSTQDDFYDNCLVILTDKDNSDRKIIRRVADYTGASKQITLDAAATFPSGLGVGDTVKIVQSGYAGVGITGGDATLANQALIQGAGYDSATHSLVAITAAISGAAGAPSLE